MSSLDSYKSNVNPKVQGLKDMIQNVPGENPDERTRAAMKYVNLARENEEYEKYARVLQKEKWEKQRDDRRARDISMIYEELGI